MITETAGSRRSRRLAGAVGRASRLLVPALVMLWLAGPVLAADPEPGSQPASQVSSLPADTHAADEPEDTTEIVSEDESAYDPTDAGNPLRIAAYVLHPVGVILDTLIFRPAYWLGSHEPIKTLVGQTD